MKIKFPNWHCANCGWHGYKLSYAEAHAQHSAFNKSQKKLCTKSLKPDGEIEHGLLPEAYELLPPATADDSKDVK